MGGWLCDLGCLYGSRVADFAGSEGRRRTLGSSLSATTQGAGLAILSCIAVNSSGPTLGRGSSIGVAVSAATCSRPSGNSRYRLVGQEVPAGGSASARPSRRSSVSMPALSRASDDGGTLRAARFVSELQAVLADWNPLKFKQPFGLTTTVKRQLLGVGVEP